VDDFAPYINNSCFRVLQKKKKKVSLGDYCFLQKFTNKKYFMCKIIFFIKHFTLNFLKLQLVISGVKNIKVIE
jgi:hypothetical protein